MGYAWIDERVNGGRLMEFETEACRHCQAVIAIGRRASGPYTIVATETRNDIAPAGGHCATCNGPICAGCGRQGAAAGGVCIPFMRRVDAAYAAMQRAELMARQRR